MRPEHVCAICGELRGEDSLVEPDKHRAWFCRDCRTKLYHRLNDQHVLGS